MPRESTTTLPPAFSLLNSEFNDFLFAPIGEDRNGTLLTVLSALARSDVDPWQESDRLRRLSKGAAIQRLAAIIAGLPNAPGAQAEADTIAARLIALLPGKATPGRILYDAVPSGGRGTRLALLSFIVVLVGLMFFAISSRVLRAPHDGNASASATMSLPPAPASELP